MSGALRVAVIAWLITSIYYFYQYLLRSAPAVMMPEMAAAFGLTTASLASLLGLFYYGYAPFALVAGVALDRLGARKIVSLGAGIIALGALLFAIGDPHLALIGRFLQGAGGAFALLGAVYIVSTNFPAASAATMIGLTQMFGSAGGSAGQFLVGPAISHGLPWNQFWLLMGLSGAAIAILLYALIPSRPVTGARSDGPWLREAGAALRAVLGNPHSILCGLIAGLMFIPTTIFDMVWGVRFLQEGYDVPYSLAVLRSASVPFGWVIGAPLLGLLSDRIGRRKPVIIGGAVVLFICVAFILYGPPGLFPPFTLGLLTGVASGAAMLPYTVIKEVNRSDQSGTATGVINFINFGLSAMLGPVFAWLLTRSSANGERELSDYQTAFAPLLVGLAIAIVLTFFLRETGPAAKDTRTA